jgi:multicomponent Na+:H+ antiporter subunit E
MMRLALVLLLAIVWCLLSGAFTIWNLVAGVVIGALITRAVARPPGRSPFRHNALTMLRFGAYFAAILTKSNLQIAWEVITPGMSQRPRIIRYPVGHLTSAQKTTLANAITLTPGTLVLDISPDGRFLYIHCMYAQDRERAVASIDELADRLNRWVFA